VLLDELPIRETFAAVIAVYVPVRARLLPLPGKKLCHRVARPLIAVGDVTLGFLSLMAIGTDPLLEGGV
jgi:hypothetical protein